jgi:uncharacterized protein (DUF362 family)
MDEGRRPTFPGASRRPFLKKLAGALAAPWLLPPRAAAAEYRVGVGASSDAYDAARRAVAASGEWPAMAGRSVVLKPNLVLGMSAESGGTTSAEVVRALVDLALESGATRVAIVEGGRRGAPFSACGYDFLRTYDPGGRVSLVDLTFEPAALAGVPSGYTYGRLYLPRLVLDPDTAFVSAAKLKTHVETAASLSLKNLFGLPPIQPYFDPEQAEFRSRYKLHGRGVHQCIVDLALARPVDFAVVDGIWGMEGDAPDQGTPVRADLVVAGRNAVAVDRVCLDAMALPQERAQHLAYAAWKGLGPASMTQVAVAGDAYAPRAFRPAVIPPVVWVPRAVPFAFAPGAGARTAVSYRLGEAAETRLEVVRPSDAMPGLAPVRTLRDWTARPPGIETLAWDGRDDAGQLVPPGAYAIRARARQDEASMFSAGTGWTAVLG